MAHPAEKVQQDRNALIGVIHLDQGSRNRLPGFERTVDEQDAGLRLIDILFVFGVGIEADVALAGLLDTGRRLDYGLRIADDLATEQFSQSLCGNFHFVLQNYTKILSFPQQLLSLPRLRGRKVLFFYAIQTMILKQTIEALAQAHLQGTELTLVEVTVSPDNDIEVIITREGGGVSIDDCVALSRYIESKLDRDKEDFSLMVGSAGI